MSDGIGGRGNGVMMLYLGTEITRTRKESLFFFTSVFLLPYSLGVWDDAYQSMYS